MSALSSCGVTREASFAKPPSTRHAPASGRVDDRPAIRPRRLTIAVCNRCRLCQPRVGGYVVIFGMLAAMVSDMLFVPVLYLAFRHVRKRVIGAPKAKGMENVMAG